MIAPPPATILRPFGAKTNMIGLTPMIDSISSLSQAKPEAIIYKRPVAGIVLAVLNWLAFLPTALFICGVVESYVFYWKDGEEQWGQLGITLFGFLLIIAQILWLPLNIWAWIGLRKVVSRRFLRVMLVPELANVIGIVFGFLFPFAWVHIFSKG
jgi:hypothetical protein